MEPANPLLGQWKIMKIEKNTEKTIQNNEKYGKTRKKVRLIFQSWGRRLGVAEGGLQSPGSRTWTQQRVRMFHVNHRWGSWGPTAQSWIWRWWNMFFRLNSLLKIAHLKHFCCQQRAAPRITGFKACPKECNKPRSGKKRCCLGAQIVDLTTTRCVFCFG